jgi:hypothetical protein
MHSISVEENNPARLDLKVILALLGHSCASLAERRQERAKGTREKG